MTRSGRHRLELFLSPAGEGGQTLDGGLDHRALAATGATPDEDDQGDQGDAGGDQDAAPHHFFDLGGHPNSLADQGWGVIAPAGERGDRLLGSC